MGEEPSISFFRIEIKLPLAYHSLIPMVAMAEGKKTEELLAQIILNDPRIIAKKEWFDKLPPEPEDGDFGLRPRTKVLGDTRK